MTSAGHITTETVHVSLGDRSYDILISGGLVQHAGSAIAKRLPGIRAAIVTDENLAALHLQPLLASLAQAGIAATAITVAAGEKSKSFATLEFVTNAILEARLERGDAVVAFGGGVIGDLAGFVAGIVRRGMNFIQIPTSLLAQVDSSVGGKTGINTAYGKNLAGIFNQPQLVLADTDILNTLSRREFAAGYAEIVKYGLIDQPDFFIWLENNWQDVFAGGTVRQQAIATACRAKAAVVARDERESGDRALLNLGHTFGHALETATGYDSARLVHGEAVAIGMVLAHQFSARLGLVSETVAARVEAHLKTVGLPVSMQEIAGLPSADVLMSYIAQDKKVSRGSLTFILIRGLGRSFIAKDINAADVQAFLQDKLSAS